jgi:hypothetical protein
MGVVAARPRTPARAVVPRGPARHDRAIVAIAAPDDARRGSDLRPPRYGLLLAAALASVAVQGTTGPGRVQLVVVAALSGACLLLALRGAEIDRRLFALAAAAAAVVLGLSVLKAITGDLGDGAVRLMNAALVAFGPPAVALGVLRDLRSSGQVRLDAVFGVLSLYLLIGLLFAFVYGAIDGLGGDPVFAAGGSATPSHCLYFSFTTLTTVGYGDLVTRSDLGHTVAVIEALVGQIYLVTVVSLIVSNLGHAARSGRDR